MTNLTAAPSKLRNGSWGAKVNGSVEEGDTVTITTRSGKSWDAIVERVVWEGNGVSIFSTRSLDRPVQSTSRPTYGADSCGYPCAVTGRRCTQDDLCHDCQ